MPTPTPPTLAEMAAACEAEADRHASMGRICGVSLDGKRALHEAGDRTFRAAAATLRSHAAVLASLKETVSALELVPDDLMPSLYVDPWGMLADAKTVIARAEGQP